MIGQFFFFSLLMITLLAGAFVYFFPAQKSINPLKFMMDKSGYNSQESLNFKKIQQFNITRDKGLIKIHKLMDQVNQEQNNLLDSVQDQQHILDDTGREISDMMRTAQQINVKDTKDVLQLEALASQMQDQQRLLVAQGDNLVALNDQLIRNRESIADQIGMVNNNSGTSLNSPLQNYDSLNDQSSGQQQNIEDHIRSMLDKEHDNMQELADTIEKNKELMKDSQDKLANSQQRYEDSMQRTQDLVEDEGQRQ